MRTLIRSSLASTLLALLVQACGGGGGTETMGATSDTGDETSETNSPSSSEAGSDTGTSEMHAICDQYLACIAATTPEALPPAQMGFGSDGTCWQGDAAAAQVCLDACQTGLEQYNKAYPEEPKCALCEAHSECDMAAGELCHLGRCTVTTCGDGIVDAMEICDSQPGCDADCQGPSECNPFTNYGCFSPMQCIVELQVIMGSPRGVSNCSQFMGWTPEGDDCSSADGILCAQGLDCAKPSQLPACAEPDGCCTRLCDLGLAEPCPAGTACVPYGGWFDLELVPELSYLGICLKN
jgi:hypothetical protein